MKFLLLVILLCSVGLQSSAALKGGEKEYDQISVGQYATCLVKSGRLSCWGSTGAYEYKILPVPTDLNAVIQVSVAHAHACALTVTGVRCWGDKRSLGIPYEGWADDPKNLRNPIAVRADAYSSCALTDEGVVCWGRTVQKPFGSRVPTEIAAKGFCAKFSGQWECAPVSSGTIPTSIGTIVQLASEYEHKCALTDKKEVFCWGMNPYGELKVPKLRNPREIAVGQFRSCAVTDVGIVCWGYTSQQPILPDLKNPRNLVLGGIGYMCADTDDGLRCWGTMQPSYP